MPAPLVLTCSLSSDIVPAAKGPRLVYLMIEISGGEGAETLPGNLSFIIDASESMRIRLVNDQQFADLARGGQVQEVMTDGVPAYQVAADSGEWMSTLPRRIDYVTKALRIAGEFLRPADYFSLIAFAGWAHTLIPSLPGAERARLAEIAQDLEHIHLGDETHLAEGLALGFNELQRRGNGQRAARMILLTDGHTMRVKECYEWADRARQQGYKLTTMGIGAEFNEDLLIPLADMTGGNAYYIANAEQIPEAFLSELGSAQHISYRNVELKLQLTRGVELRHVYRVLPEMTDAEPPIEMGDSLSIHIGDFDPGAPIALLLEIILPSWEPGVYRLAQSVLVWEDPGEAEQRHNLRRDITVQTADITTVRMDERVMNRVERVGAYRMGKQAIEAAQEAVLNVDQQGKGQATVRLRQAATRLLDMGESDLANTMLLQAQALESVGRLNPEATKKLRYDTRRLAQNP